MTMTRKKALAVLQKQKVAEAVKNGEELFMGLPDNWYEPNPQWGCENGHLMQSYINSETRGCICPKCMTPIALLPKVYTEESLKAAIDEIYNEGNKCTTT